jgi:hypothetical protein
VGRPWPAFLARILRRSSSTSFRFCVRIAKAKFQRLKPHSFYGLYVVADATTHKHSRVATQTLQPVWFGIAPDAAKGPQTEVCATKGDPSLRLNSTQKVDIPERTPCVPVRNAGWHPREIGQCFALDTNIDSDIAGTTVPPAGLEPHTMRIEQVPVALSEGLVNQDS